MFGPVGLGANLTFGTTNLEFIRVSTEVVAVVPLLKQYRLFRFHTLPVTCFWWKFINVFSDLFSVLEFK